MWKQKNVKVARDKYGGGIDVRQRSIKDDHLKESLRKIPALYGESVFHNAGVIENDGMEEEGIQVAFGGEAADQVDS